MLKGTLIGNLGRDAELKTIGGSQYAIFNVAHSERRTDMNGQLQEQTTWVRCLKRDVNARLAPYLTKGKKVYVDGRLSLSSYTTQQGESRYELSIWVDSLEFMDGGNGGGQQTTQAQQAQPQPQNQRAYYAPGYTPPQAAPQPQGGWLQDMWAADKAKSGSAQQSAPQTANDDDPFPF